MKIKERKKNKVNNNNVISGYHFCKKPSEFFLNVVKGEYKAHIYKSILLASAVCTIYGVAVLRGGSSFATIDNSSFSVTPTLEDYPNLKSYMIADSTKPRSGIKIVNTGLGPLTIKDIRIYRRDRLKPIENTSYSLRKEFNLNRNLFKLNTIHSKDSLKQGEELWLMRSIKNSRIESRKIREVANNIGIVACYCSIRGECYNKTFGWEVEHDMKC